MSSLRKVFIIIGTLFILFIFSWSEEIHEAVKKGNFEKVKKMITKEPGLINQKDKRDSTPLHYAAYAGKTDITNLLISKGADIKVQDKDGHTPLHWAAQAGKHITAELLIAKGAMVNAKGKNGRTPLLYALWRGHKNLVDLFIRKGAEINTRDTSGYTPLHYASLEGQDFIAKLLINRGAEIEMRDNDDNSAFHLAAYNGRKEIVKHMISKKTDVNLSVDSGDTAIFGAAWGGHKKTVELLISSGAKVNIKNKNGRFPLNYALLAGHKEVAELLISKNGKKINKRIMDSADSASITEVGPGEKNLIKMTVLYDNYVFAEGTKSDWEFSCLVEGTEKTILFDTGGKGDILRFNMDKAGVNLKNIDMIVLSHNHWDHTGGLSMILDKNPEIPVYIPYSFPYDFVRRVEKYKTEVIPVNKPRKLCKNIYLTGEMGDKIKEQSLILNTDKGLIIITGCSHPGIVNIVKRAREIIKKKVYLVFGGFHLMRYSEEEIKKIIQEFKKMEVLKCGATHCTGDKAIQLFKEAYGKNYVNIGTGRVLKFSEKGLE